MSLLLETTLGDLVIDLDIEGSPELSKNVLKLAKARYYTSTLVFNVQVNRFCQLGDPQGDGSGGACIYGLISSLQASDDGKLHNDTIRQSQKRFLKSNMGRPLTQQECQEKGRVVATEMKGVPDTIGSQLLITTSEGKDMALDGFDSSSGSQRKLFRSVGVVREDENNVLDQIAAAYCDADGRPYADIRIIRALIVDDPFDDPPGMIPLLKERGVEFDEINHLVTSSPDYERPPEEKVEIRIQADQVDPLIGEDDLEKMREQEEQIQRREDKSRAVVLEMLGDLPDADIQAPENVLFVCKLNPITEDEDLELIFSRFDEKVKAEIIRDQDTGSSLQYAFVEFSTKDQAVEAYFKMNNALVDDRRIKVDFSQSVAKVWNKFTQRMKNPSGNRSNQHMPKDPFSDSQRRASRGGGHAPRNLSQGGRNDQHMRLQQLRSNTHDRAHFRHPEGREGGYRHEEGLDAFGRRQRPPSPRRDRNNHDDSRRGVPDRDHKDETHHEKSRSRRYDSDSGSRENLKHSRRRHRSRSSERKRRKRSHKRHKSHRKRSRDDSSEDDERSRDAERDRHRIRERHDDKEGNCDRKDRSDVKRSPIRSDSHHHSRDRSRDRRKRSDREKHHGDDCDREHRRRSGHKERESDHRK